MNAAKETFTNYRCNHKWEPVKYTDVLGGQYTHFCDKCWGYKCEDKREQASKVMHEGH